METNPSGEKDYMIRARLLVLQRKCWYPGEHAPEVLSVVDEWTLDENPEWWSSEVTKQKASIGDEADAWAEVDIHLPASVIERALYPERVVVVPETVIPPRKP